MLGLICYVLSALLFFLLALDFLDREPEVVYFATGLIPAGLALSGVAIPSFTFKR
jgi:hypothetical protein